jgi:NAD-dependent dihydropyrimidine dehydrogenase PreA subunit
MNVDERYRQAAQTIAGGSPGAGVSDALVDIIKALVEEEEIDLILAFKEKRSQSLDQLKESSGFTEERILEQTSALAKKGIIFNQPNSKGVKVFRLLPLANVGVFEYTFMKKLTHTEEEQKLADLFARYFEERRAGLKISPEKLAGLIKHIPAPDRTVPIRVNKDSGKPTVIDIDEDLGQTADKILLTQDVKNLIEKFDEIAVGHCFCRQHKDTQGKPCQQTDLRETCFTFGKSARFTTDNGFMRMIDKEEALEILLQAEKDGLVHKAYHPNFDISKAETSVCNCCKDCCGNSTWAIINVASFLAKVDPELCVGCGTCAERCHPGAIKLGDDQVSHVDEELCIGCGVCAYFCPENAIQLTETPPRTVRVVPQR